MGYGDDSIKWPNRNKPRQRRKGVRMLADGTTQTWVKPFGSRKGYWSPPKKNRVPK